KANILIYSISLHDALPIYTTINYTYTDGKGCTGSASSSITVHALPNVTLGVINDVCYGAGPRVLKNGSPSGGSYSGKGISGVTRSEEHTSELQSLAYLVCR